MKKQRVIAIYCRVSSDDQRERETIRTQQDTIERQLEIAGDDVVVFRWYLDDGVSGTIPMELRDEGRDLVADAVAHRFTELWFTRSSRLSRDEVDALKLYALMDGLGIAMVGVSEPVGDRTMFGFSAVMHAAARRQFLADSAKGMERAAREGRYCGGIVPLGFRVDGKKQTARLVPDERLFWKELSAAELVREIYAWLLEGWSCYRIADHLNELGVPTAYTRDERLVMRGTRKQRTQNKWRPGRIRNLVVNPVYKGILCYGRRSDKTRDVIESQVPALVSPEVWDAAQRALRENQIIVKHDQSVHLLRSLIDCGLCDLKYSWTKGRDVVWYRCNGQVTHRGKIEGRCPSKSIRGDFLEPLVWADVEAYLRNPGDLIQELAAHQHDTTAAASREAERVMRESAIAAIPKQRNRILDAYKRGYCDDAELAEQMKQIGIEEAAHRKRLAELSPVPEPEGEIDVDLLQQLRDRLDRGIDDEMRYQLLRILVRGIKVITVIGADGKKSVTISVVYRFPAVGHDSTGTGSSPPPA